MPCSLYPPPYLTSVPEGKKVQKNNPSGQDGWSVVIQHMCGNKGRWWKELVVYWLRFFFFFFSSNKLDPTCIPSATVSHNYYSSDIRKERDKDLEVAVECL